MPYRVALKRNTYAPAAEGRFRSDLRRAVGAGLSQPSQIILSRSPSAQGRDYLGWLKATTASDLADRLWSLTKKERDILGLIANGLCNKEIGNRLGIETTTIKAHTGSIFRKLGVNNRVKAAIYMLWVSMVLDVALLETEIRQRMEPETE